MEKATTPSSPLAEKVRYFRDHQQIPFVMFNRFYPLRKPRQYQVGWKIKQN